MRSIEENTRRHHDACHAMQSGVAIELERGSTSGTPKHLRVGVNVALRDQASLVKLLISKGLISEEEYMEAIADGMEVEKADYEQRLSAELGTIIKLG